MRTAPEFLDLGTRVVATAVKGREVKQARGRITGRTYEANPHYDVTTDAGEVLPNLEADAVRVLGQKLRAVQ